MLIKEHCAYHPATWMMGIPSWDPSERGEKFENFNGKNSKLRQLSVFRIRALSRHITPFSGDFDRNSQNGDKWSHEFSVLVYGAYNNHANITLTAPNGTGRPDNGGQNLIPDDPRV
jgi:hypothetical protein